MVTVGDQTVKLILLNSNVTQVLKFQGFVSRLPIWYNGRVRIYYLLGVSTMVFMLSAGMAIGLLQAYGSITGR